MPYDELMSEVSQVIQHLLEEVRRATDEVSTLQNELDLALRRQRDAALALRSLSNLMGHSPYFGSAGIDDKTSAEIREILSGAPGLSGARSRISAHAWRRSLATEGLFDPIPDRSVPGDAISDSSINASPSRSGGPSGRSEEIKENPIDGLANVADFEVAPKRIKSTSIVTRIVRSSGIPLTRERVLEMMQEQGEVPITWKNPKNAVGTALNRAVSQGWLDTDGRGSFFGPTSLETLE